MREWLMRVVAGRNAYWLSERAERELSDLKVGVVGAGAAIALVDAAKKNGLNSAKWVVDEWTIIVSKTENT